MKILFVPSAEPSHVVAMAPAVWAARLAGHDIRVAAAPSVVGTVVDAGLTAVPVGTDHTMGELLETHGAAVENEIADWSDPFAGVHSWESILLKYQVAIPYGLALYTEPVLDDIVRFARSWQPHVVVWDQLAYAGPIAARACGAASARLLWMVDIYSAMRAVFLDTAAEEPLVRHQDPLREWLSALLGSYGLDYDETVVHGDFTIDQIPSSVQLPSEHHVQRARFSPYNGRSVVPSWLSDEPAPRHARDAVRPRVCVTGSTSFGSGTGGGFLPISECLEALADLDVDVILTLGRTDRSTLGTIPGNVQTVDFAPFHVLLPTCSAVVHHGGYGTWATSITYGVPQLTIPIRHGDLWIRGSRTESIGAAVNVHPTALTAPLLASVVADLVDPNGIHAAEAQTLSDEVAATPSLVDVAAEFDSLVRDFSPAAVR